MDKILEQLHGNKSFRVKHCPPDKYGEWQRKEHEDWQRNAKPETDCCCTDVIYTAEEWSKESLLMSGFEYASIIIASANTKCWKWEHDIGSWKFSPKVVGTHGSRLEYRQVDRNMSVSKIRDLIKMASHKEAHMLARASPELQKTYNKGHVNIRGVPFPINRLRKALMYQDENTLFDLTVITYGPDWKEREKEACSVLFMLGGQHHILVHSQSHSYAKELKGMTSIGYDAYD